MARSDVSAAISAADLLINRVDHLGDDLYYPLFSAMVVCYARPFTNNRPYGSIPNRYERFESQRHRRIHRQIIDARHELIAHSDMTIRKAQIVPAGTRIGRHGDQDINSAGLGSQVSHYFFTISMFPEVKATAKIFGDRINSDIETLLHELYEGMELPKRPFDLKVDDGL